MKKKTAMPSKPKPPEFPKSIETFRKFSSYHLNDWERDTPSAMNGEVCIRKYRITIEEIIDEDAERERLRKLWREGDNHHHWEPMQAVASRLGIELHSDDFGKDRPSRR